MNRKTITVRINEDIYNRIIAATEKASLQLNAWCVIALTEAVDRPTWASLSAELAHEMMEKGRK